MKKNRVLILGGGFGGLYAALEFEKRRDPDFEVTLISQDNFFLFTPMLHEVAASDLDLTHIVNPIRKMLRHVHFFEGEIRSVDVAKRLITVRDPNGELVELEVAPEVRNLAQVHAGGPVRLDLHADAITLGRQGPRERVAAKQ